MHQSEVEVDIFIHLLLLVQMWGRSIVCLKQRETEERKVLSYIYRNRRKRDPFCLFVMENVLQQSRELFSCFKIPFLETPKISICELCRAKFNNQVGMNVGLTFCTV